MTETQAHNRAQKASRRPGVTFFVVRELQDDGTFYDACSSFDLETHYNGIHDGNILACYEEGQQQ